MWIQWINESLWQASELLGRLQDDRSQYFQDADVEMFSYIAHPPLLVSVLTSAAMVEEVGAVVIKELETDVNPDLDNTALEEVLGWLQEEDLAPETIDLDILDDTLRDARNDLAHSMTARGTTVTLDTFADYIEAVQMAVGLGLNLADRLVADAFSDLKDLPLTPEMNNR
jgi:hypothetical protein